MGTLLIWIGFGLASTNWFVLIFVGGLVTYAIIRRIQVEEEVLFERFGVDYQAYADETARYVLFFFAKKKGCIGSL
jgi:protein-S-isoprenylcysteine O-methyltransferase Ste14